MKALDLGNFTIEAPAAYQVKMLLLCGPRDAPNPKRPSYLKNVMISWEEVSAGLDAEAYARAQLGHLAGSLPGYQRLRSEDIEIGGVAARLVEIRCMGPNGIHLANLLAYCVLGRTAYTLSASHLMGHWFSGARSEFLRIFESLTFSEGAVGAAA